MMRIIAGTLRGHVLRGPRGSAIRPTSGLLREAIFDSLQARRYSLARVLDLYAGTGAMGIEALSRSAEWVDFVDRSPAACALIRDNLRRTGLASRGRVHCVPILRTLGHLPGPYHAVFCDPPYRDSPWPVLLDTVSRARLIAPGGVLVAEHPAHGTLPQRGVGLTLVLQRRHGDSAFSIYCTEEALDTGHLPR